MEGDAKYAPSQDLPDIPYGRWAEMLGLRGTRVEEPDAIRPAWEAAFAADRPMGIDAGVDPNVPPLPPHISFEQAVAMTRAILKGDPDSAEIIRHALGDLAEAYRPHR